MLRLLDENIELKSQMSELNRRFHELEIEYRRLENEREELGAAYKESEAVWSAFLEKNC